MTIQEFNLLAPGELKKQLFSCCGSTSWVNKMLGFFPMEELVELLTDAEEQWYKCTETDWREAFSYSPTIDDLVSAGAYPGITNKPNGQGVTIMPEKEPALDEARKKYQEKFGFPYITVASEKPEEMLASMENRLLNAPENEIKIAMDEQNKITQLKLQSLLQ